MENNGLFQLRYDERNRLDRVIVGALTTTYGVNGLGERVAKDGPISGSLTPLVGLGLFGATGPSGSASSSSVAAPSFSGSATRMLQVGVSDGFGAEVARAMNDDPLDWSGSGGRIGAGAYAAVGDRFAGTITSPAWGCSR
jgi:hypothetical protein